ncbi:hypothetical protein TSUD_134680 [Trifolium subterraneum]|uniref:Uncharacterized protein n=1 Tax=Trifolium subterraneum TaxID=3900 RepID=A0A2Z6N9Q6_TRISU|nr:hypothetical protein TSUD_134680 [Trifolium subterraneum]
MLTKKTCFDLIEEMDRNSTGVEDDLAPCVVQNNGSVSKPIEVDPADCTPVKRGFVEVAYENDGASSRILKNIKIEKD